MGKGDGLQDALDFYYRELSDCLMGKGEGLRESLDFEAKKMAYSLHGKEKAYQMLGNFK